MIEYTRLYNSAENAQAAVSALRQDGYADDLLSFSAPKAAGGYWTVGVQAPFGSGRDATDILDWYDPVGTASNFGHVRDPGVDSIAALSGPTDPGSISTLSRRVSPGAISSLSRTGSPGAISRLSRRISPGAISRLSRKVSPGAISRLSRPQRSESISRLSSR